MIGPFRGGRVVAVTGVPGDPAAFYFGAVGGGVWKTTDAGTVWRPIFDSQKISSIGAIAVAPSNPKVLYVGTGEADIRSQIGFGDGVYKSEDAGETWKNVGLRDSRQISKIVVDPRNPDLVYVAALGHAYGPNGERGVFRSSDGGAHWRKVLDRGPEVGAADLALDPANPQTLYAAMWNGSRSVWSAYAALEGPGSGMFRSVDGGEHWTAVEAHGLPTSKWGRSGVAVFPGGKHVYALVDAKDAGGLYRSDDSGATWTLTSGDSRLTQRSWYFSSVTVDPKNPDEVFVPNVTVLHSSDGGRTFTVAKGAPGGDDYHLLWIDPSDTRRRILGSDQGTNVSLDAGRTWSTWFNQPTAQMYHVITDNRFPYAVMGSQQDSGTAAVMSRTDHGEIDARDWFPVGGAESGYIAVDTKDDNILYVGDTVGTLERIDRRTREAQIVTPSPIHTGGPAGSIAIQKYRFPWTAPILTSRAEPGAVFMGAQYVLKSVDGALTWSEISPDLTGDTRTDKSQAPASVTRETAIGAGFGVVYSIALSPLNPAVIWAGSDTGLLHVTRDGGKHWDNVTPKGLPIWSKVSQLEASHFDPAVAYASVDRHRMEDYKPYIYRTRDYGKTWTLLNRGLAEPAFLNCVREDPSRRGLLFGCTEFGVVVSFDDGENWQSLQLNMPTVSVRDLVVHGDDLAIATFGRGFWILDDASPLRQIDAAAASAEAFLYTPAAAIRTNPEPFTGTPFPVEEPKAKNPPQGAMLDYGLESPSGEVTLEIHDSKGALVRRLSTNDPPAATPKPPVFAPGWVEPLPRVTANVGMNRFVWDLRYGAPGTELGIEDDYGRAIPGPQVLPGTYQVSLTVNGKTYTRPLEVKLDPRSKATPDDLKRQLELSLKIVKAIGEWSARGAAAKDAISELTMALKIAESADRTPPATAYRIYEEVIARTAK